MAAAVCGGPSLWVSSSKRGQGVHVQWQCSSDEMAALSCHYSSNSEFKSLLLFRAINGCPLRSHVALHKLGLARALWSARSRQGCKLKKGYAFVVYGLERLGLDPVEDGNGKDLDNWEMFAAEEGVRPAADNETESDSKMEDEPRALRRRTAWDILPSFPDSAAVNWTAEKVKALQDFRRKYEVKGGQFMVEAMRTKHMDDTEELLVDSFAELMGGLLTYRPLLAFTVKLYKRERYASLPHSVTLVGLYAHVDGIPVAEGSLDLQQGHEPVLAGTVELSFSVAGHPDVPAPAPPPNSPYICNMAIRNEYRRRGLGRQMLKAAEELALSMGCEDMYLHVRIMDVAPLTMYREAGYQVVATDSLLFVLTFQRRRHLMRKRLSRTKTLMPEF